MLIIILLIKNKTMSITKCLKEALKKLDLFPATQFLRYKQDADYKTATGGFISITILVTFCILFFNLAVETVNQEIITGSVSYNIQAQPSPISFSFAKGSQFMFSVGIQGLNLSSTVNVFFNITMRQNYYSPLFNLTSSTNIPLIQCSPQHFSSNSDISSLYKKFAITNALCPPLNYQFNIGGRAVSQVYSRIQIYIQSCNKTTNNNCASDQQLSKFEQKMGGFRLMVPTVNTIINVEDQQYKKVYLQDRNYNYFSRTSAIEVIGEIQQYQINTDVSLLPYSDIFTQLVKAIPNLFLAKSKAVLGNRYAQINLIKSNRSTIFTRSFNKIDTFLSYVGGLVGTTLIVFLILGYYSEKAYVINIAQQIYQIQEQKQQKFNFFYFIVMAIKKVVQIVFKQRKWQSSNRFQNILQQMQKQLNISFLLKRMNYYEDAISAILSQHQIISIYLNDKKSITAAAISRKTSNISKNILSKEARQKTEKVSTNKLNSVLNQQDLNKKSSMAVQQKSNSNIAEFCDDNYSYDQGQIQRIKESLIQVIRQSYQGDPISRRIIQRLSKSTLIEQIGVSLDNLKKQKTKGVNVINQISSQIIQVNQNFQFLEFEETK